MTDTSQQNQNQIQNQMHKHKHNKNQKNNHNQESSGDSSYDSLNELSLPAQEAPWIKSIPYPDRHVLDIYLNKIGAISQQEFSVLADYLADFDYQILLVAINYAITQEYPYQACLEILDQWRQKNQHK